MLAKSGEVSASRFGGGKMHGSARLNSQRHEFKSDAHAAVAKLFERGPGRAAELAGRGGTIK